MKINYNVTGNERKKLVKLISEITEVPSKYLGVPSCAYQVGPYHIGKDGELTFDTEVGGLGSRCHHQIIPGQLDLIDAQLARTDLADELTRARAVWAGRFAAPPTSWASCRCR